MSENKNMRELSLDEMDKVSGGVDIYCNGTTKSDDEVYDMAMAMVDAFGYDVASATFCKMTGLDPYESQRVLRGDLSDKENMKLLVHRCVQIYKKKHGY